MLRSAGAQKLGTLGSDRLAEPRQSKAFGWLAFSSALLVLVASVVAISRLGDDDGDRRVASAPTTVPPRVDGETGTASGDGGAGASGPASDANAAAGAAGGGGTRPTAGTAGGTAAGGRAAAGGERATGGRSGAGSAAAVDSGTGSPSAAPPRGEARADQPTGQPDGAGGGTPGGGQDGGQPPGPGNNEGPPPAPSQEPPEQDTRLVAASASAGEGAQGGVISVAADGTDLDVDLTLGRDQLVGDHPPSDGTGVSFGGRLLNPPSASPAFPTLSG